MSYNYHWVTLCCGAQVQFKCSTYPPKFDLSTTAKCDPIIVVNLVRPKGVAEHEF
jgi:hypothetical protein